MELTSLGLILYVYFTNRRVHKHWLHLLNVDQTLPIRVSLRRNMDVAGALIASDLLHAAYFACVHVGGIIVYLVHASRVPPATLVIVPCKLLLSKDSTTQAICSDLVLRMFVGFHMLCHPWILIGMMPALRDSCFIAPTLGFDES